MKIGIDARMYASEFGIGVYIAQLLESLLQIDDANEYVIFFNKSGFAEFRMPENAKAKNVQKILADIPHYSLKEQLVFPAFLGRHNLDIMHFTNFNAPILYRRPAVVTIHDLTIKFFPGKKYTSPFARIAYRLVLDSIVRRAKKIISVSEHTKKDLLRLYRIHEEKIRVIHLGVNSSFRLIEDEKLRSEFREKNNLREPYLLYAGSWRDHKNLVNLIKAFGILKEKFKIPHLLVITGKDDPWYPEVKKTVAEKKLEGSVRFAGVLPTDDLPLLFNCADIYVFPSLYEGFGLPALESFACGVPVVAANSSSLPEVCAEAAEYFDPKNPEDIGSVIQSVLSNGEKKKELRKKGFERVQLFSWEKTAKLTLAAYREAAS